jgi:uncharacterized membrane protein YraQ (UPF0718 family)
MILREAGMEMIDAVMKWIVAPVTGFVIFMFNRQQRHETEIAVIRATMSEQKTAHDREFKEMRENFKAVFAKLDSIEQALRK